MIIGVGLDARLGLSFDELRLRRRAGGKKWASKGPVDARRWRAGLVPYLRCVVGGLQGRPR